jgi:hypothetical protein
VTTARERVAAWIKLIQDAKLDKATRDMQADLQSLDRAADLEEIYQNYPWIDEIPAPKRKRLGRRIDPKGREQFAKWVKQTYDGWGSTSQLDRLHRAHELLPILSPAGDGTRPTGERVLRPLAKLREQGYGDHQAEVWQEAVKFAGNAAPTESQVRKAVTEFLERHKSPIRNVAADPRTAAEIRAARRARLIAQFDELLAEENRTALEVLNEMTRHFKDHQALLREERPATEESRREAVAAVFDMLQSRAT